MANKNDNLGDRMKNDYEMRMRSYIPRRSNVMLRLDGKSFHTYTKKLQKPWDSGFTHDMISTAEYLCQHIQGAKLGYVQSDEISILFTDYDAIYTDMWFDGQVQKIVSVSASMAAAKFNQLRIARMIDRFEPAKNWRAFSDHTQNPDMEQVSMAVMNMKIAEFDSRVYVLPNPQEVVNAFLWRQQDATRNSIQMLARSKFSNTEMHQKHTSELQEMMFAKDGTNWNDTPVMYKRGVSIRRDPDSTNSKKSWVVDYDMPVLSADRNYVLKALPDINAL